MVVQFSVDPVQLQACSLPNHPQQNIMKSLMHQNVLDLTLMQPPENIDNPVTRVKDPVNRGELEDKPQRPSQYRSHTSA